MESLITLDKVAKGKNVKVFKVTSTGALRRRIMDMGVVPGVEIAIKGKAFLGDPIHVVLRGYSLSLRKEEAAGILVEVI